MALPQETLKTIADIDALPEGTKAELIDGRLFFDTAPTLTHQDIVGFYTVQSGVILESKVASARSLYRQLMYS